MDVAAAACEFPVRVYWSDTDAGGVVYHSRYLDFCEHARTEWLRSRAIAQRALVERDSVIFTVVRLTIDFRRPARLDDLLIVRSHPRITGGASVEFEQEIWREEGGAELLASVAVRVACLDAASFRPRRLPESLRKELA